jgi:tetratricopeptide (TPR) repeat protein
MGETMDRWARMQIGVEHHRAGRLEEAEAAYREVLATNPTDFDALHLLGVIAQQSGRTDMAVELIGQAIRLRPQVAAAHSNLGNALKSAGRLEEAIGEYRKAVELNPALAEAHFNLGKGLADAGYWAAAAPCYRRAIEIRGDYAEAWGNLGAALAGMNDLSGAAAACRRCIELKPDAAQGHGGLGYVLLLRGEMEESIGACRRAIELNQDYADAHCNLAMGLLVLGEYAEGWREHEWRARMPQFVTPDFKAPQWRGEDLAGKTIFVHSEQGFGDTIHFCRYVPLVARRGAGVIIACPEELNRLLHSLKGVARFLLPGEERPSVDFHCPMFSLPLGFGTTVDSIPAEVPYLRADPALGGKWREIAGGAGSKMKVGLAWSGRVSPPGRSIPAALLPALGNDRVQFFSLQKSVTDMPGRLDVVDCSKELTDFSQTAALIEEMDLVISIDTAAAQLAGAMGKKVWILLKRGADWRWGQEGSESPWYPTAKLYRQVKEGEWSEPIGRVAEDLRALTEARSR